MQAVISVFGDHADAQRALDSLVRQGFSREDLHIERDTGNGATAHEAEVHDRGSVSGKPMRELRRQRNQSLAGQR